MESYTQKITNEFIFYLGVSLYAVREHEPGVKEHVITTVFSPSQDGLSAMTCE